MGLRRLRLGLAMLTYQDWLLFCFVLGVLGGTAAALAFGGPVVQGCILGAAGTAGAGNRYGAKDFLAVWKQRAFETGAGWLAGLTVCSQMLFGFLTFYAGMSLAVVLSIWTMRKGILGIAAFLCSMLPHGIVCAFCLVGPGAEETPYPARTFAGSHVGGRGVPGDMGISAAVRALLSTFRGKCRRTYG